MKIEFESTCWLLGSGREVTTEYARWDGSTWWIGAWFPRFTAVGTVIVQREYRLLDVTFEPPPPPCPRCGGEGTVIAIQRDSDWWTETLCPECSTPDWAWEAEKEEAWKAHNRRHSAYGFLEGG